ncbi:MAG TPA: HD domain-containing phosphohydrolase [Vicinamibacterales bacterium]|nr:HD domain-containing phosphohydrolase [Vicinamibacterales bacterium]
MKMLPLPARIFVCSVIAVGAVLLAYFFPLNSFREPSLFLLLLMLSSITSVFKVNLPLARSGSTMSVSYAVDFASLLLLGPNETMIVAAASAWSQCTFRIKERNPIYRTFFSMGCLVITVQAAGFIYGWIQPNPVTRNEGFGAWIQTLPKPLVWAATTYFLINTAMVATAIALSTRQSIGKVWNENFLWSAPSYFVGAGAAALAVGIYNFVSVTWLLPLAAAPLYLTYSGYKMYLGRIEDEQRHVREMADLHLATIEALALAIDAKDQTSQSHIRRVQLYAAALARALGMSENEIQGVKTAALLHDIGKLAVPEHILSKPGPLTPEEFQKIRAHPKVGADIISAVPFPYPVSPLILSHHERWDGKGYPSGLKGEDIPLGARILSVVDYFDALMAERPYHKAMGFDAAVGLLQQEAGKGLDPRVVDKFIELLPTLQREASTLEQAMRRSSASEEHSHAVGKPATGLTPEPAKKNVFDDIALAHREIYALYEIAQAMGTSLGVADTMALISAKLSNLVPFSCAALFLYDEESETLRCRFATGVDAEIIQQISVHTGEGLTGWVARNRRALVNARPSADLEAAGRSDLHTNLQSALVCPLLFSERFIGTLSVYHVDAAYYRDDHRRLLDRVSEQAAAVINNSMLFEQTQEDSLTDPLTGLPNTRFLFMHLTRELARAERLKQEVALLVMDLDNFKSINDSHGHHVGDRALCEVARVLRTAIRPYDICVRYAGDEFIVVLSGCNTEEAESKRTELQQTIDDVYFEARPGKRVALGISVGAAVFPQDGESYEALLATADSRMYQDKSHRKRAAGRERPEPPAPQFPEVTETDIQKAAAGIL